MEGYSGRMRDRTIRKEDAIMLLESVRNIKLENKVMIYFTDESVEQKKDFI